MSFIMPLVPIVFSWLVESALLCSVLLAVGYLFAGVCRQPADRLRVLQWTLGITLMALILTALPTHWKLAIPVATSADSNLASLLPARRPPTENALASERQPVDVGEFAASDAPATATALESSAQHPQAKPVAPPTAAAPVANRLDWLPGITVCVAGFYLAGGTLLMLRWVVARLRLRQIYGDSSEAPAAIRAQFVRLTHARSDHVDLRMSSQLATPLTWGVWSPVIMLPQSVAADNDSATLRYFLAHEWAHIHRRDSWSWQLAVGLQFFLYYHPLYWMVRRSLLVSMDRLADAEAAGQGETAIDYAQFLVQLARYRQLPFRQLTLGVSDKESQLKQRVEYLLSRNGATNMFCSPGRAIAIAALAIVIGVLSSAVRFEARAIANDQSVEDEQMDREAQPGGEEQPGPATDEALTTETPADLLKRIVDIAHPQVAELLKVCSQEHDDGSITYYGFVTDAAAGIPIVDATVKVHHKLSRDPKTGGWSTLEVTDHKSNAIGLYSFTLPPEQTSEGSLYIEIEAHHPKYANKGRSGYSHAMIRKNLELGELPFYTRIKLWPGETIEGTIVSPAGEPLTDVEISMYAASDKASGFPAGSFNHATTDSEGRFHIVPPTPGDGVLWIKPANYSPQAHRIADRRGDWGELKMELGATITGQVLDVNEQPVRNVRVEARRRGDGEEADEYLHSNAVANQIGRRVVTDDDGKFTLASLPDGDYIMEVETNSREGDYDPRPLDDVFLRQSLKIADKQSQQIVIRAVPHVVLYGTYLDSDNQPRTGHEVSLFGRLDGEFYFARSNSAGDDGKFELKIPHGLREAKLDLITNEHSALKWRMSRDEPLQRGRDISLGTVEDDIYGFEVVRYKAPILLVKAVDEQGRLVSDVTPIVTYTREKTESEQMTMYTTGSQVSFEGQGDGRHRSSQLLPDEPISVTVRKDGFQTTAQEISLEEGQERELEFVVKSGSGSESVADTSENPVTGTLENE